jgi:hypothetical protein
MRYSCFSLQDFRVDFSGRGDKQTFTSAERIHQGDWTIDLYGTVVVRLVGGPAEGLVFVVPQSNLPKFVGVGFPENFQAAY